MIEITIGAALILTVAAANAEPPEAQFNAKRIELMEKTKVVALMNLDVPAAEYKSDGDPDTLEIVFLDKKKDGPSRVSEDGEVIFLYKASDKKQSELIQEAFNIRTRLRLGN